MDIVIHINSLVEGFLSPLVSCQYGEVLLASQLHLTKLINKQEYEVSRNVNGEGKNIDPTGVQSSVLKVGRTSHAAHVVLVSKHVDVVDIAYVHHTSESEETIDDENEGDFVH